jgi:S1-C subfamily serine protease
VLTPCELGETPEAKVTIIKVAEPDPNPYHRQYEEMLYPTVRIETPDGVGSGVVISHRDTEAETYILTAAHVVGDAGKVTVEFFSHQDTKTQSNIEANVLITDTNKDLALLRVLCDSVATAKLAPRDYTPYIFTPVWVVGCSLGLQPRPSQGIITAITLSLPSPLEGEGKGEGMNYWEISAPIVPGNSGGPVYDARTHEVIGIAVWVRTYQGQLITTMAGVVPIQSIYEFLDSHRGTEGTEDKDSVFSVSPWQTKAKARSEGLDAQQARPLSIGKPRHSSGSKRL